MSEGIFAPYENYFGGTNLVSDLSVGVPLHGFDSDYLKDVVPATQQSLGEQHITQQLFHSQQLSPFGNTLTVNGGPISGPTNMVTADCISGNNVAGIASNNTNNTNAFVNIPFVQIHTTDVQPQRGFNGNSFRRNASNNVIKSEPIKSENADAAKDHINTTPTPPSRVNSGSATCRTANAKDTNRSSVNELLPSVSDTNINVNDGENLTSTLGCDSKNASAVFPELHKCTNCPFISLNANDLEAHTILVHSSDLYENRRNDLEPIKCLGCENIFYVLRSLSVHLKEDHMMSKQEVKELLQALSKPESAMGLTTDSRRTTSSAEACEQMENTKERRSRIYLKNVECLRDPHREPIEREENIIPDNIFHFENECNPIMNVGLEEHDFNSMLASTENAKKNKNNNTVMEPVTVKPVSNTKQKISIKSVDVLREPALLRRDYEMQTFGSFMNVFNDLDLHAGDATNENNLTSNVNVEQFNYCTEDRQTLTDNNNENDVNKINDGKKPRKPKIYIKNVDILKEPMTFNGNISNSNIIDPMNFNFIQPSLPQPTTTFLDNIENLNPTVPTFSNSLTLPMSVVSDQYLFDNSTNNFIGGNSTSIDSFNFVNDSNTSNFLMGTNRFQGTLEGDTRTEHSSITPIITEPTPPPLVGTNISSNTENSINTPLQTAAPKQKIFIKNVDILKEPQFQEHRGTLHLRTVDELNLMNKIEVENLIRPNLENTQSNINSSQQCEDEEVDEHFTSLNEQLEQLSDVVPTSNEALNTLYEDSSFKLQELSSQGVNVWGDDYDITEDIREIIKDTIVPGLQTPQKIIHDLDTPQMSLISIRDIEELTGCQQDNNTYDCSTGLNSDMVESVANMEAMNLPSLACAVTNVEQTPVIQKEVSVPIVPLHTPAVTNGLKKVRTTRNDSIVQRDIVVLEKSSVTNFENMPPLTPVIPAVATPLATCGGIAQTTQTVTVCNDVSSTTRLPVPPLVPMSTSNQLQKSNTTPNNSVTQTTPERGRIYVANNLIQPPPLVPVQQIALKTPVAIAVTGGTSVRGRPFGSNRTCATNTRQSENTSATNMYLKCTVMACPFRFKKANTLEYHSKCHISASAPQSMRCPECNSKDFNNWNTLHTHLWRTHKIDMELYSCELCSFKTPIYSRLLNTHSKIHYEERNYKCDQCDKAFKNTKQLKNHRRWHRNHTIKSTVKSARKSTERTFHRCKDCNAVFSQLKSLRGHSCKNTPTAPFQCEMCKRVLSSRSSLKLHMQSHEVVRRYKCSTCDYKTSDHNAFRRHKMTHEDKKTYECKHCDYKSIQSTVFQKHMLQKHPQVANSVVHKCTICSFVTVNKWMFDMHQVKHEQQSDSTTAMIRTANNHTIATESNKNNSMSETKIKVKSHLVLTTPSAKSDKSCLEASPKKQAQ